MKKIIFTGLFILCITSIRSFSQTIALPSDSITLLLCTKWEVNYTLIGNMKITRMPGAPEVNYEFNKDNTFFMTSSDGKNKTKGNWVYDAKKKIIKLTANGRSNTTIISLKKDELIMFVDTKEATPADPMEIRIVYKIKTKA